MFKIGNRINTENPTNVYKLIISNMSGRGDHYEKTETLISKEFEPVIVDLIELCDWVKKENPNRNKIAERYKELQSKHNEYFTNEIDISYEPIIGRDIIFDDTICKPEFFKLTWFDENGIEYQVNERG